jgi:uncharacterized protein (TIGR03086 family)
MTEISERYLRLSDQFAARVAAVSPDAWDQPTPCEDWTVRDLVGHVVDSQGMFLGFIGDEVGEVPSVADDPVGAWDATRGAVQRDLDDPDRAGAEFEGLMGVQTFESAVDRFLCMDLVVHGWDLARATGQDEEITPEELARVSETATSFGDAMRSPRAFGPEVDLPPGADDQVRLLAFLGRRA